MKNFEKLYALDKKGKIRFFEIKIRENSDSCEILSATGLLDGNPVINYKSVTSGKGGRSIIEQAELEANSKFESKLDEGYKQDIEFVRNSKWNTSKNNTPLPMLAQTYKKNKYKFPMIAQRKYDGVRCMAINEPIRLCSRGGKYYTGLNHIEKELKEIFDKFPNIILDGELYAHGYPMARISGDCRRETRDIFEDVTYLQYHVYDIAIDYPQKIREAKRLAISSEFTDLKYIKFVDSIPVFDEKTVKILHDKFVEEGYEGLILRQREKPYYFSFRDDALLKVKEFMEEEFTIVDYEMDYDIGVASFKFICEMEDGRTFGVRPIGSHTLWEEYMFNIDKIKGEKATVKFLNYSVNGIPEKANIKTIRNYE